MGISNANVENKTSVAGVSDAGNFRSAGTGTTGSEVAREGQCGVLNGWSQRAKDSLDRFHEWWATGFQIRSSNEWANDHDNDN